MSEPHPIKVGRPKNIESPEMMWELFKSYKTEVKDNPFIVKDWVGAKAIEVEREKEKPLTMEGFENYLFRNNVITDVSDYFENKQERYSEFVPITRAIRREIRQDQIEGGMAMIYNPSVTQRLNGLVDKKEDDGTHKLIIEYKNSTDIPTDSPSGTAPSSL